MIYVKNKIIIGLILCMSLIIFNQTMCRAKEYNDDDLKRIYLFKYINRYRDYLNVPLINLNPILNESAQAHSKYMSRNDVLTKEEIKRNKYYIGVNPWDRAAYFGYSSPNIIEDISQNNYSYQRVVDEFIENPYKRLYWLNPEYTNMGIGCADDTYTFDFGVNNIKENYLVIYPAENQEGINPSWYVNTPNPFRKEGLYYKQVGLPITFSYFSNNTIKEFKSIEIELKEKNSGKQVDFIYKTPKTDEFLKETILIVPTEEYKQNTEYEVYVKTNIKFTNASAKTIQKRWVFRTFGGQYVQNQTIKNYYTYKPIKYQNDLQYVDLNNHWVKEVVKKIENRNINIQDSSNKYLNPDGNVNSETLKEILQNILSVRITEDGNIVGSISKNLLKTNEYVNREQMITILMSIYQKLNGKNSIDYNLSSDYNFSDMKNSSSWSRVYIQNAKKIGLINGRGNNMFYPKQNITKAELIMAIYRLLDVIGEI